ncbi:unnamed protein product [Gongylonema pulchrum]|uniref:RPN6_N domain-containing protein n=1 Tax=Gongylonema pulchrum TaxID=637853 RepID=A0A183EP04_9BILA|nr:unnamed protein product [Gongylonema pulchrum]
MFVQVPSITVDPPSDDGKSNASDDEDNYDDLKTAKGDEPKELNDKEKSANDLLHAVGKILQVQRGGIAALYQRNLDSPNAPLGKILQSLLFRD